MPYSSRATLLAVGLATASLALPCEQALAGTMALPSSGANSASASSWLGGAHAGYNWQRGSGVFGFETDLQATHLNSAMSGGLVYPPVGTPSPGDFAMTSSTINWYGTARGRVGFASGPWLVYGTAGLAYGDVNLSSSFRAAGLQLTSQVSDTRLGWVAGLGAEYLVNPNLSVRLGYQYVDLGSLGLSASSPSPAVIVLGQQATASARFQAVTAGFSWHFAPMGASMPWQGGYAGAHGGGAWGNNTSATYTSTVINPP